MAIKNSWYKTWWGVGLIIILIIILIFLIAVGFYFFNLVKQNKNNLTNQKIRPTSQTYNVSTLDNFWLGTANPKITIIEFSDFACFFCKNSYYNVREINLKYKDKVKIIFKDYPLHEESTALAMAGRCAGEQGLFWLMHDKLFQNQGINTNQQLIELAKQIGADVNKFTDCLTKQKYLTNIQKDIAEGVKLNLTGTPTWFINGYKIEGDIPHDVFTQTLERLLIY
ncbi:MAG: thioredoxin domain-containing protein [Patescibacteria group bacterium]|nr:DsbA family protein [Patescibacteria group bacterium]MBU1870595.1 DsbA family protein [Patescibacteria group bacterium]